MNQTLKVPITLHWLEREQGGTYLPCKQLAIKYFIWTLPSAVPGTSQVCKNTCKFVTYLPITFEGWESKFKQKVLVSAYLVHIYSHICKLLKFRHSVTFLSVLDSRWSAAIWGCTSGEEYMVNKRIFILCS